MSTERAEETFPDGCRCEIETPDIKLGTWSRKTGLQRAPVRSVNDYNAIEKAGEHLLARVKQLSQQAPFPLRDRCELWLLDAEADLPLALISSACPGEELEPPVHLNWNPGRVSRDLFSAPSRMHRYAAMAGACHSTLVTDLNGTQLSSLTDRHLPPEAFPELLLRESWPQRAVADLIQDFLAWQAPFLLLPQDLSEQRRAALEKAASKRATEVAAQHRLYPQVIDRRGLKSVLVEAVIRGSNTVDTGGDGEVLSPFYLEI